MLKIRSVDFEGLPEPKRRSGGFQNGEVWRVDTMKAGLTGHERVTKVVLAVLIVLDILPLEVGAASAEESFESV